MQEKSTQVQPQVSGLTTRKENGKQLVSVIKYCSTAVFWVSVVSFAAKRLSAVSLWLFTVVCDNCDAQFTNDWFEGTI